MPVFPYSTSARGLVLELFAGIGGASYALRQAGLPDSDLTHTLLFETDPACARTLRSNLLGPNVSLSGACSPSGISCCATAFTDGPIDLVFDLLQCFPAADSILVVGGSPCQGLSRANRAPLGLNDPRSCLVYAFAVLVARLRAGLTALKRNTAVVHFLVENVQMADVHVQAISELLGIQPLSLCASSFTCTRRDRLYWTSLPDLQTITIEQHSLTPDLVCDSGWSPAWQILLPHVLGTSADRWHVPTRPWPPGLPPECPTRCWSFGPRMYGPHLLALHDDIPDAILTRVRQELSGPFSPTSRAAFIEDIHMGQLGRWVRPLHSHELERALGYPDGASDFTDSSFDDLVPREFGRHARLANGFSVPVVSGLLLSWVTNLLASAYTSCAPGPPPRDGHGPRTLDKLDALSVLQSGGLGRPSAHSARAASS